MNLKYIEKLEYSNILEKLSNYCITELGKQFCFALCPSSNKEEVCYLLQQTNEAIKLTVQDKPSIINIPNIDYSLKMLKSSSILTLKSILELAQVLKTAFMLKNYFYFERDINEFPIVDSYFSQLYANPSIVKTVEDCIIDENTLSDSASTKLSSIRKQQRKLEETIKEKLNHFLHSSTYSKYVQENVITIRNNRYVIPIKEEYRSMVKGFVHDISTSRFYCVYRANGCI